MDAESHRPLILLLDDSLDFRRMLSSYLKHDGWEVIEAESIAAAVRALGMFPTLSIVLVDNCLGDDTGMDAHALLWPLLQSRKGGRFIVLTGSLGNGDADFFKSVGVTVLLKTELPAALESVLLAPALT